MKKFTLTLAALSLIALSHPAQAWTRLATCGTGDALEGMDVFTDGENIIVQVLSYEVTPEGEDQIVANEYRTNNGMVNEQVIDVNQVMQDLKQGKALSFMVTKEESFAFGGLTNKAALLNIKLNAADPEAADHYDHSSLLAFEGNVASFFCY